jgi:two-component system sensor histidine kinase KdpD
MAIRQTAHEVDIRHNAADSAAPGRAGGRQGRREHPGSAADRLLLHVSVDPATAGLIRRGRRVADYLQAECLAVAVERRTDLAHLPPEQRARLEKHLEFARNLHIETRVLEGTDAAAALVGFARSQRITQIFVTRPEQVPWSALLGRSSAQRVVQLARDMRVTIVASRRRGGALPNR